MPEVIINFNNEDLQKRNTRKDLLQEPKTAEELIFSNKKQKRATKQVV